VVGYDLGVMRVACAVLSLLVCLPGCRSAHPESELTHEECAELVRHVQKLEAADTGGLQVALNAGLKSNIEGCKAKATQTAYRCVMQAETAKDLEACNMLMKE
jgi:hypothetical protein